MAVSPYSQSVGQLVTYRPQQQHYGMFLAGFPWTLYCAGSFRQMPRDDHQATICLNRFLRSLGDAMRLRKRDIACYAALEDRTPGLGGRPVRKHWHFLLACPEHPLLESVAEQLWIASNGWPKIEQYDPAKPGVHYINKLIAEGSFCYYRNLDTLPYSGPSDLITACASNSYVPDRLKDKTSGEYLVRRPFLIGMLVPRRSRGTTVVMILAALLFSVVAVCCR
jgi:hypothetical protein